MEFVKEYNGSIELSVFVSENGASDNTSFGEKKVVKNRVNNTSVKVL